MKRAIILMLLLASAAGADTTYTVDTDGGGDYLKLSLAVAGDQAANGTSLSGRGTVKFNLDGATADNAAVDLTTYTDASETDHIELVCTDPHSGVWTTSKYRLAVATAYATALQPAPYTHMYGLQIAETGSLGYGVTVPAGGNCVISRCLIRGTAADGIYAVGTMTVQNCGIWACDVAMDIRSASTILNTTVANCTTRGISLGNEVTLTLKNCYAGGTTAADADYYKSKGTMSFTTCYSEDGSQSTPTRAFTTDNFANVTPGSEDLHLVSGSGLIGQGTDVSATMDPDEDVDGDSRPQGATWDVGYDEYAESAAPAWTTTDVTVFFRALDKTTGEPNTAPNVADYTPCYVLSRGSLVQPTTKLTPLAGGATQGHTDDNGLHMGLGFIRWDVNDTPFAGDPGDRVYLMLVDGTGEDRFDPPFLIVQPAPPVDTVLVDGKALPDSQDMAEALDASNTATTVGTIDGKADTISTAVVTTIPGLIGTPSVDLASDIAATDAKVDTVDTVADGIKAKTDQLTFTEANKVDATTSTDSIADIAQAVYDKLIGFLSTLL